jgi:hypothetical protein
MSKEIDILQTKKEINNASGFSGNASKRSVKIAGNRIESLQQTEAGHHASLQQVEQQPRSVIAGV